MAKKMPKGYKAAKDFFGAYNQGKLNKNDPAVKAAYNQHFKVHSQGVKQKMLSKGKPFIKAKQAGVKGSKTVKIVPKSSSSGNRIRLFKMVGGKKVYTGYKTKNSGSSSSSKGGYDSNGVRTKITRTVNGKKTVTYRPGPMSSKIKKR